MTEFCLFSHQSKQSFSPLNGSKNSKESIVKYLKLGLSVFIATFIISGCSSSNDLAKASEALDSPATQDPEERKSVNWCNENYSSAEIRSPERRFNAKYCSPQARQAYRDAREKNRNVDIYTNSSTH